MTRRSGRLFSISSPRSCQQSSSINIGTGDCQEGKKKYLRFRARQFPTGCVRSPAGKLEPRAERALASRRKSGLRWVSASSMARRAVACLPAWRISASWSEDPKVNEFIIRYPPEFAGPSMWHNDGKRRSPIYPPTTIPSALLRRHVFIFLGRLQ